MTITFNKNYSTVIINDIEIELSQEHYNLLYYVSHTKKIVPNDELRAVLKDEWRSDDCVRTAICNINGLIKEYIGKRIIYNRRGMGYYVKPSLQVVEL